MAVNVGVIGLGYWGPNIVRNLNEIEGCRVTKACDVKPGRLKFIGSRYPHIDVTSEYKEILKDDSIDAVCIVTPVSTHFGLAKEALLSRKDVFVEKPLARFTREAEELIEISEREDRILMVGHIFEYSPAVLQMKQMIEEEEIGDILYIDSSRINLGPPASEVSVIWDLVPHDLSIIFYLTEAEPQEVSAIAHSYVKKTVAEMAYITVKFDGDLLGHIHVSWLAPCKLRRTHVIGSRKVIVFDDTESVEKVKVFNEGYDTRVNTDNFGEFQLTYTRGDIYSPRLDNHEPLRIECEHFIESVSNRTRPKTDGQDGLRVVKVLELAEKSVRNNGAWQKV